ncbi:undecaprenyl-diphosphatase UppP [Candidatus Falkowbacteria bacterium]|uniref:Undecaprenyl-diphosphatase n=1 Tax=Candidatus Buchananbacteria bacterium CG10_big_fil_rev_8_21_14_0_10_33_19 TaxID=1974525 RepID=A0A2H0W471_9BACT|nr:undecaprenyl-diphosphatase UppP [Candidatus Falkowbacteria bacterium]PIS06153.1 MAG: undecaprenyl-diphosphatase UppP [Candidatus Buchananbacteria bacterium CG10_big_fil_rev_8_21_14_0_10_33_19]
MDYLLSIIAGIIQGLTEFLPISSSGHLILFHDIFGFHFPDELLFDVMLHVGTLIAVAIFFYHDIQKIIRGFLSSLVNWNLKNNYNQRIAWLVLIGIVPAGLVGYLFEDFITNTLRSPLVVAISLIVIGLLFFVIEKYAKQQKDLQMTSPVDSLVVGLAQILALIPGVSRSGITIIAGMGRSLKREEAAKFSFLISAPIIFGAAFKQLLEIRNFNDANFLVLMLGVLSSAITGYLVIKYLIRYLSHHSLNIFAWYRLIIGCLTLIWFLFFFTGV